MQKTLIIVGGGTFFLYASQSLINLVDHHEIPVLTTSLYKGIFPDTHSVQVVAAR